MYKSILLKITIAFIAIVFSFKANAQSPTYQWAKQFSTASGGAQTSEIVTDNSGNVYVTGLLGGPMDFDPGAGTLTLSASGLSGSYVGKYDTNGNLLWAFKIDGTGTDEGRGIAVDNAGNVFVTGKFQNTVDFDPSAGTANLIASTSQEFYLAKYSSAGTYINAIKHTSTILSIGNDVAINAANEVVVTGKFAGTTDFDPSGGTLNLVSGPSAAGFLAKYSNSLALIWADGFGGGGTVEPHRIGFDAIDKIYICGEFTNTCDMDGGAGVSNIVTTNVVSIFYAKYNTDGTFRWAKSISSSNSSGNQFAYDLAMDNNANIYLIGSINVYQTDFDPGIPLYNLIPLGTSGSGCYLAKFDSSGVFNWAFVFGAANTTNEATNVDVDINNNPVVVGYFRTGTDFDPGAGTVTLPANGSFEAAFCAKYSSLGNYIWAFSLPPSPSAGSWPFMQCDVSNTNYLHINGNFTQTVDFNPYSPPASLFTSGSDIYIAKYDAGCTVAPSTPGTISGTTTICSGTTNTYSVSSVAGATSYTWSLPGGWTGTSTTNSISTTASTTSGNITVTANNACGNSSAQTLSVTVNTIPATPSSISGTTTICSGSSNTYSVSAVAGATSYTWSLPGGWSGTSTTNSINATASATSGNITVTANNVCGNSSAQTLSVTVNTIPATPGTISGLASMCIGTGAQTYSITAIGGATSYTWTLPATWSGTSTTTSIVATPGTSAGSITVTANNTCGNSSPQTLAVVINPLPVVAYSQSPALVCVNTTSVALGTASPAGGTFTGTAVTGSAFNASTAGTGTFTITYTYTDGNGCVNAANSSIVVDPCTDIQQSTNNQQLIVYPNPTSSIVTLSGLENESTIEVFNVLGEKVISVQNQNSSVDLDLTELENGIYFIKVSSEKGTITKRIVKQ